MPIDCLLGVYRCSYQKLCQVLDFLGNWTRADEVRSANFASLMSYVDYYRKQNEVTMERNKGIGEWMSATVK